MSLPKPSLPSLLEPPNIDALEPANAGRMGKEVDESGSLITLGGLVLVPPKSPA
jgi:hypothetical protein